MRDESWDQTKDSKTDFIPQHHLKSRLNGAQCQGRFFYTDGDDNYQKILVGKCVKYPENDQHGDKNEFYLTKTIIKAAEKEWLVEIEGRQMIPQAGLGVLPLPVAVNEVPSLSDQNPEQLFIKEKAWPEPRMRTFMAVVVSEQSIYGKDLATLKKSNKELIENIAKWEEMLKNDPAATDNNKSCKDLIEEAKKQIRANNFYKRNLCKVREIAPNTINEKVSLNNTIWVEMGSPFADADSGVLARPRKGNILFCIDRGDMSIPIAVTAMFRQDNIMPMLSMKTNDVSSYAIDLNAVTIRNRSYTRDEEEYQKNETVSENSVEDFTIPKSVEKLCLMNPGFSQIQLIGKDNNTEPKVFRSTHPAPSSYEITTRNIRNTDGCSGEKNFSDAISRLAVTETIYAYGKGTNLANSMLYQKAHYPNAADLATPAKREHFQGINISSEKDLLQQSVDSQFINAGGIINITAAAGINLRVGRSCITITEAGINITGGYGHVNNPGAHAAYNVSEEAEDIKISGQHSASLSLNESGAVLSGINTKVLASNHVLASVPMGSYFALSNYSSALSAPSTTVIGGAALGNTFLYGIQTALDFSLGLASDMTGNSGAATTKSVIDEGILMGREAVTAFKELFSGDALSRYTNMINPLGSMISLAPSALNVSAYEYNNSSTSQRKFTFAGSGLDALSANSILPMKFCKMLSLSKEEKTLDAWNAQQLRKKRTSLQRIIESFSSDESSISEDDASGSLEIKSLTDDEQILQSQQEILEEEEEILDKEAIVLFNDEMKGDSEETDGIEKDMSGLHQTNGPQLNS